MEGVITRSKSSRQKDDASKSKSHKSGSKSSVTSSSKRSETSSVLKARAAARAAKLQVEMEALKQKELLEREELILATAQRRTTTGIGKISRRRNKKTSNSKSKRRMGDNESQANSTKKNLILNVLRLKVILLTRSPKEAYLFLVGVNTKLLQNPSRNQVQVNRKLPAQANLKLFL